MATALARAATTGQIERTETVNSLDPQAIHQRLSDLIGVCDVAAPLEHGEDGGAQQVLLDAEFSGYRYLLIRMQARSGKSASTLSPREQEIARMVAKGYPNKAIAAVLDISCWTVCTHLRRMFAKLNVSSRAAMVAQLVEDGSLRS
jgi:DNA-binding CsgD family transcriptional regulator